MLMELGIGPEDMVGDEDVVVSHLFNGLHEGVDRPKIGPDFGLRKDRSDFHNEGSLVRSFRLTIWRPDVGRSSACPLRSLSAPAPDGSAKLEEVGRLRVGLERRLVFIHFIEPDAVGIIGILNDIEPEATRLVAHGTLGVLCNGGDERFLEPWFDLDWCDDDVQNTPSTWVSANNVTRRTESAVRPPAMAPDGLVR